MHDLTARAGALLIVNDRGDIARLTGAEGVHVGQEDLPAAAVRRLVGPDLLVGLSSHTDEQVRRAVSEPISYLAIGPVFTTTTKEGAHPAVGLSGVRRAVQAAGPRALGVIAIGGITLAGAREIVDAGAAGVAVISDLLAGGDPEARTRAFIARLAEVGTV
jgi:thiamine-phosphate pyrophosphorylase